MSQIFYLQLTLHSDTTFGRGDGIAGLVDEEVEHDPSTGLPFLRGRTLKGLLTEECANVLYALPEKVSEALQQTARDLFGNSGSRVEDNGGLHVGAATLPSEIVSAITHDIAAKRYTASAVLDALTDIRRQTAMTAEGAPEEGSLRAIRVIVRETIFEAQLTLDNLEGPAATRSLALLAASVLGLRRVGLGRNRGRGRVSARLLDANRQDITMRDFDNFTKFVASPSLTPLEEMTGNPKENEKRQAAKACNGKVILTYDIELLEPLLATKLDGEPNSAVSYDYLPGTLLRGAFVHAYLRAHGIKSENLLEAESAQFANTLFFNGSTRFLNAYLRQDPKGRVLPAAKTWQRNKEEVRKETDEKKCNITDFAHKPDTSPNIQWKGVSGMGLYDGTTFVAAQISKLLTVHTTRDRNFGRATSESGTVYRYEALAAGQVFRAHVLCDDAAAADEMRRLIENPAPTGLGGARTAGYGQVKMTLVSCMDTAKSVDDWQEQLRISANTECLVITLLSDVLLRDDNGNYVCSPDLLKTALEKQLGNNISLQPYSTQHWAYLSATIVGGFNRTWGLPLPQTQAIGMGSVLVFKRPNGLSDTDTALNNLRWRGIGERRVEGFGRVAVDWHGDNPLISVAKLDESKGDATEVPISAVNRPMAKYIGEQMLRRRLDAKLIEKAIDFGECARFKSISRSQLGRLMAILRDMLRDLSIEEPDKEPPEQRLEKYFVSIEKRSSTRNQFNPSALKWLRKYSSTPEIRSDDGLEGIWNVLGVSTDDLLKIGDQIIPLNTPLAKEYALRLMHETLAFAAKASKIMEMRNDK